MRIHCFIVIFLMTGVAQAGTLKGKFSFKKRPPKLGLIYMSEDHSLKAGPVIDQKGKSFLQPLYVGPKNKEMTFKNSDEVSHNIFSQDTDAGVSFDVGLMPIGATQKKEIDWEKGKVVRIGCKIHPNMRSYVANVDSKFHKILEIPKKKTFEFVLENVPDNLSEVSIWLSSSFEPIVIKVEKGTKSKIDIKKKDKTYGELEIAHE